jgi:hypothetical protein
MFKRASNLDGFLHKRPKLLDIVRLRVFGNRVLRRIFGPGKDEVTGGWRQLHNEELRNLHSPPSIIKMVNSRRKRRAFHVERMVKTRNA